MSETNKSMSALERFAALFEDGSFTELDAAGPDCAARAAYGCVGGVTVFAFCQDSAVCSGAVDEAQARKLSRVYDLAAKTGSPVVTIFDSNGVKLANGFASLEAGSAILGKVSELSGVVPQIAVVVGPCAGFMAMTAALADVCIMSEGGELFMTSPFAEKASGGREENVGSAAFARQAGVAGIVCEDEKSAIEKAAQLLSLLPVNNLAVLPVLDFEEPAYVDGDVIVSVADAGSAVELFEGVGESVRTVLATVGGTPCGLLEAKGELCRKATGKAARFVEVCDAFNLPVISFVDAVGFKKSAHGDKAGAIQNAAKLAHVLAEATTAKISVVTGSAIGAVYTVFCGKNGGADLSFAWENAVISPLEPKAAVNILWEDRIAKPEDIDTLAQEYASTVASAAEAARAGVVEAVLTPDATRGALISALDMLAPKRVSRLPKKHGNLPL